MVEKFYIPYEKQEDTRLNRMCGAAALAMVYHSLGLTITQSEIWKNISTPDNCGGRFVKTSVLCQDALKHGLKSMIIKAKDPLRILHICYRNSVRAILNLRLRPESALGHFTVLVRITGKYVTCHDPQYGPYKRTSQKNLLDLWLPNTSDCEIGGNTLVALTDKHLSQYICPACNTEIPDSIQCYNPRCRRIIPLQPGNLLGCVNYSCPERTWQLIFCPYCENWISP